MVNMMFSFLTLPGYTISCKPNQNDLRLPGMVVYLCLKVEKSEEHILWETLLNRLWCREFRPEQGLKLIVCDGSGE